MPVVWYCCGRRRPLCRLGVRAVGIAGGLVAHLKTPHVATFLEACAGLEILDIEVRRYEVSSVGDLVTPE